MKPSPVHARIKLTSTVTICKPDSFQRKELVAMTAHTKMLARLFAACALVALCAAAAPPPFVSFSSIS